MTTWADFAAYTPVFTGRSVDLQVDHNGLPGKLSVGAWNGERHRVVLTTVDVAAAAAAPSIAESLAAAVKNVLQRYSFFWLWLGLGILGEIFTWWFWWYLGKFVRPKKIGWKIPKFSPKKPAPTWGDLCKRKGPWRQACRWLKGPGFLTPARFVQQQRVPGVKGARGLCGSFRGTPIRSLTWKDRVTISRWKLYLLKRWPQGCPSGPQDFREHACGPRTRGTFTKEFTFYPDNRFSVRTGRFSA